jgi:lysyl oxidase
VKLRSSVLSFAFAASAAFGLFAISAGVVHAGTGGTAVELLPNIRTVKPYGFFIDYRQGDRLLHLSNEITNVQTGPLELRPEANDCNGDGDFENDRTAYQVIYADTNGNGRFDRGVDQASRSVAAGCMKFHPSHDHWHFQGYARYQLFTLAGIKAVQGTKTSFCIIDTDHYKPSVPGSPSSPYYRFCDADSTTGISAGWGDIYGASLQGQWIEIDGVPDGEYCVVSTADPSNRIIETIDSDNTGKQAIHIAGDSVGKIGAQCP